MGCQPPVRLSGQSLTCLILAGLTEIHDDLGGAGVEGVEIRSVVIIQARRREVVDTPQSVHQLPVQHRVQCRIQWNTMECRNGM